MSTFVHKVNRGSLYVNDKKETEKHPDLTGQLNVNGTLHWFKAWYVQPVEGKKMPVLNIKLGDKCEKQYADAAPQGDAIVQLLAAVLAGRQ